MPEDDDDRPIAGQRSATSLALTFASIVPVTVGSLLIWALAGVPFDGYGAALVLCGGFLAILAPYAIGWLRGMVSLLVVVAGLRLVEDSLSDQALALRILAGVALVAVVGGLTWFSLRFGTVRRPADSRVGREKRDDTWPYPYA